MLSAPAGVVQCGRAGWDYGHRAVIFDRLIGTIILNTETRRQDHSPCHGENIGSIRKFVKESAGEGISKGKTENWVTTGRRARRRRSQLCSGKLAVNRVPCSLFEVTESVP